jgi:arylsulfatase A-like enzyme
MALDASIGRVLKALEAEGAWPRTPSSSSPATTAASASRKPGRSGQKTELLEGGIRVPAIVRWPARVKAGQVSEQVAISMDWLPTLLAAAGSAPDPQYPPDGRTCCRC